MEKDSFSLIRLTGGAVASHEHLAHASAAPKTLHSFYAVGKLGPEDPNLFLRRRLARPEDPTQLLRRRLGPKVIRRGE